MKREFQSAGEVLSISNPLFLHGGKYVSIGTNFGCDKGLKLEAYDFYAGEVYSPSIIIGNGVSIQRDCHIGAVNKIIIGNNVLIGSRVFISDHSHGEVTKEALTLPPQQRKLFSKGEVIIEDNVWIGEGACILPGVTIGQNSVIGANSVVNRSVPRNCLAVGNPVRIVREIQ